MKIYMTPTRDFNASLPLDQRDTASADLIKLHLAPFFQGPAGEGGGSGAEGTAILSTGEAAGRVLTADGDNTSSWQTVAGTGDMLASANLSDVANATTARSNLGLAIGTDVQAHSTVLDNTTASFTTANATTLGTALQPAAIGTTVQAFDATIVVDADIGTTVQAHSAVLDATTASYTTANATTLGTALQPADIGTTVQAHSAVLDATTASYTTANATTLGTALQSVPSIESITDVTITTIATNELLQWNGTAWINQTLVEAGIEPADGTILKSADIGATVQAHSAVLDNTTASYTTANASTLGTALQPAAIGTTVQAYNAALTGTTGTYTTAKDTTLGTALQPAAIGTTVQAYDATIVVDADIGSTVQAHSATLDATTAAFTTAKDTTLGTALQIVDLTSDVTGILPIANIATGTPNGAQFVRDDGTLAVPPAAGSPEGVNILSTGETAGRVLVTDGDNTSSWQTVSGTGDMLAANNLSEVVPATARTNLGLVIGTDVQAHSAVLDATTSSYTTANATTLGTALQPADIGTTVQAFDATMLVDADIGSTVQAYNAALTGTTGTYTTANATTLGTALQNISGEVLSDLSNVASTVPSDGQVLTFDTVNGWQPETVSGTGDMLAANNLSDVANTTTARSNLGLAIGTDVQAYNAALTGTTGTYTTANATTLGTALQPADIGSTVQAFDATIVVDADIGSTVQAYNAALTGTTGTYTTANAATLGTALQSVPSIESITDVTITTIAANELLQWNGTAWINRTLAEAGIEPANGTILKSADIGVTVQAHSAVLDATTSSYTTANATTLGTALQPGDIGTTVQAFDATIVVDADIGTTVQAHSAVLDATTASYTTANAATLASALQDITGQALANLSNVASTVPSDGQVLTFDTTNGWQPETPTGGAEVNDLSASVTWDNVPDANITASSVTQHTAAVVTTSAVTAAGALMDSEVDPDLKTLVLPAATTISAYGATLVDDVDAATARSTLGLAIGTDIQAYSAILAATTASFLTADETKLDGIATAATANATDAALRDRATHTGTQALGTITGTGDLAALSTVGTTQIDNDAVTYAKMQNVAANSLLGNNTGGAADALALTAAQVRTLLALVVGTNVQAYNAALTGTTGTYTTANATKLSGIATAATANSTDAALRARSSHTGTQTLSTISDAGSIASKTFWQGTQTAYDGIGTKDANTIYYIEA